MSLKVYNSLTKKKEEFVPTEKDKAKIYVCGPTVYDYIHIGNGRAFVVFDVVRRFLRYLGYDVTYVMNLTDIDDRIIERAERENTDTQTITVKFIEAFFEDTEALGIERADIYPKATDHVQDIIELIQSLVDRGLAYQVNGDVFYDVSTFASYGSLSGKRIEDLVAGSRVAVDESKKNPLDFTLWKSQKPGEPGWQSPWGMGRPGWHIECSTMSMKYLGQTFDIHAGGVDLVFPHHENEIAQSEGATGKKFVKYWLHNGFLQIGGEKMAKSLGNFKTVREILKKVPTEVMRLFFLQKHYRSPIDLTDQGLQAAGSAANRLNRFYQKLQDMVMTEAPLEEESLNEKELQVLNTHRRLKSELVEAMKDDFNTPVAVSRLFDMVRELNALLTKDNLMDGERALLSQAKQDIEEVDSFFGFLRSKGSGANSELVNGLMEILIDVRKELRSRKIWDLADKIRQELDKNNIALEDKGQETAWRVK
ncbi:cysteine--tRNA ligase [candidate division KSB1 bacterium]|nr:cysteine--tRNA ligase [candidate division KSB1 bacterium]NIR70255.1 cysteine--tRNA ligase [candidate division KSB1 bacterium]NIS26526.1 cysteine--tRNA ligase [candidate division KSB1 bacterium]NIT73288.1 cysteine--tRNA ligase [candidate division KSB1 bacterium]NIU23912.1 cysteine--tRNA ligase [candidate division KSB1 bacterium]